MATNFNRKATPFYLLDYVTRLCENLNLKKKGFGDPVVRNIHYELAKYNTVIK